MTNKQRAALTYGQNKFWIKGAVANLHRVNNDIKQLETERKDTHDIIRSLEFRLLNANTSAARRAGIEVPPYRYSS